jgi:hypothetical protein
MKRWRTSALGLMVSVVLAGCRGDDRYAGPAPDKAGIHFEQRNMPAFKRGIYNQAFFFRLNDQYRTSAAIHFAHGKAHDVPQLTPLDKAYYHDTSFNAECQAWLYNPPHIEPGMILFGPYTGRFAWNLYRAIDWTHVHHEQTYDIMASKAIPWDKKKEWTDMAVRAYLERMPDTARSVAPLDVTMRRAGTMMKPYFSLWRNNYPRSNNFFYLAHWWHPVIYEAQMIGGNDAEQDQAVRDTHALTFTQVDHDRPLRMLLSRECMPRYSRMSPESANIFDNLHMLHGIAYDILSYDGWNEDQKRAELYRVIEAMSYQPGDEKLARKFSIPHPDMDPRIYYDWMKTFDGDMNRIMFEMHEEMMPLMMPQGQQMSDDMKQKMRDQLRMKLTPGMQEGEIAGSWQDAMKQLMPGMKMDPESMQPGKSSQKMIDAMLQGWQEKYGDLPDVEPIDMSQEPSLPPEPTTQPAQRVAATAPH